MSMLALVKLTATSSSVEKVTSVISVIDTHPFTRVNSIQQAVVYPLKLNSLFLDMSKETPIVHHF